MSWDDIQAITDEDWREIFESEQVLGERSKTMKTRNIVDITDEFGLALTSEDIHKLAQTIPADDDIPADYSDRERIGMYLRYDAITLDIITPSSTIWSKLAEKYGPVSGYSLPDSWPTDGFMVHGTEYLEAISGDNSGNLFLLVPHGYGYDWIDKDLCGGDGSGETRKALGI